MIVIPMAGQSSRFKAAGYEIPKFMLNAHGKTLFEWSISSFTKYFKLETFVFITLKDEYIEDFVKEKICNLGITNFKIISLDPTTGQAHSVYDGLKKLILDESSNSILIFNIDTIRWNFEFPEGIDDCNGFLEVFEGEGSNWSYVLSHNNSNLVQKVAEKDPISNLACTGIYYFANYWDFFNAYEEGLKITLNDIALKERYVAPLYNYLIENNKKIIYSLVDKAQITFCGVPNEYEFFRNNDLPKYK